MQILYRDPEKDKKLKEAIQLGFIHHEIIDGLDFYAITQKGQIQWMTERLINGHGR